MELHPRIRERMMVQHFKRAALNGRPAAELHFMTCFGLEWAKHLLRGSPLDETKTEASADRRRTDLANRYTEISKARQRAYHSKLEALKAKRGKDTSNEDEDVGGTPED